MLLNTLVGRDLVDIKKDTAWLTTFALESATIILRVHETKEVYTKTMT